MKFLKWAAFSLLGLIVIVGISAVVLWVTTDGDYVVLATVTDDPDVPAIDIKNVRLHTETFGDTNNPTIVVLHGGPGGDYRSLLGLTALSDHYRVVFYDQRGAGLSERVSTEALTVEDYVGELDALIDLLAVDDDLILIGHSWGATLAAAYIGQYPERVDAAILMEPGYLDGAERDQFLVTSRGMMAGFDFIKQAVVTGFQAQHVDGPDSAAANDFLIGEMAHVFANDAQNPYHCPGREYDAPYWRFGATASQASAAFSNKSLDAVSTNLSLSEAPVLILSGACNNWLGEPLQAQHVGLFQNAELIVIDNAGHELVWDRPDATLRAISKFLAVARN